VVVIVVILKRVAEKSYQPSVLRSSSRFSADDSQRACYSSRQFDLSQIQPGAMTITIYHNPRCSKSRKTLEIIQDAGIAPKVVKYIEEPPDGDRIRELAATIGVPVSGILRRNEDEFRDANDLPDLDDDAALAAWLARHPRVMQRPIVIDDDAGVAVIGRPPESVAELLPS
jgi:arsenate reductase